MYKLSIENFDCNRYGEGTTFQRFFKENGSLTPLLGVRL